MGTLGILGSKFLKILKLMGTLDVDGRGVVGLGVERCWGTPIRCWERELSTLRISVNLNISSEEKELIL
jgi:hypothetical protein